MDKIKSWHVIMGVIAMVFVGFFFCDGRWNEDTAIAENKFCAASNKEMYLKITLNQICQRYGFNAYPCPTSRMTDQDKVNYKQYEEWYKAERQRIRRMFGG